MSKKAMEHVDSRELEAERLWRAEAGEVPTDEPAEIVVKRPPAHKDTKTWCKGKTGRTHELTIDIPPNGFRMTGRPNCYWVDLVLSQPPWWSCNHVERCTRCGKVFRRCYGWSRDSDLKPQDCPDYQPRTLRTADGS